VLPGEAAAVAVGVKPGLGALAGLAAPAEPVVEPDADASASRRGALAADVVDGRVNPGGVSGANPGVLDADDSSAMALVELELAPDADRDDAIDVESV
jgi:hypothetical protein